MKKYITFLLALLVTVVSIATPAGRYLGTPSDEGVSKSETVCISNTIENENVFDLNEISPLFVTNNESENLLHVYPGSYTSSFYFIFKRYEEYLSIHAYRDIDLIHTTNKQLEKPPLYKYLE